MCIQPQQALQAHSQQHHSPSVSARTGGRSARLHASGSRFLRRGQGRASVQTLIPAGDSPGARQPSEPPLPLADGLCLYPAAQSAAALVRVGMSVDKIVPRIYGINCISAALRAAAAVPALPRFKPALPAQQTSGIGGLEVNIMMLLLGLHRGRASASRRQAGFLGSPRIAINCNNTPATRGGACDPWRGGSHHALAILTRCAAVTEHCR